jgi:hypothetical protein
MKYRRTSIAMLYILLSVAAGGCAAIAPTEVGAMTRYTLDHDGLEREYFVFSPSSYDNEQHYRVAIFMHGYGGRFLRGITYRMVSTKALKDRFAPRRRRSTPALRNVACVVSVAGRRAMMTSDSSRS